MAEAGIGVDLVEIARMERIITQTPGFFTRMFTEEERMYCEATARPAAHYACRFAAREAVLKALGTGFGQDGVGRNDVTVSKDANGRPIALLSGGALEVARKLGVIEVAISLSFTGELAVANAMAITADARPKPKEEKLTERQRIAQSFREARAVLDELERVQDSELLEITGESAIQESPAQGQDGLAGGSWPHDMNASLPQGSGDVNAGAELVSSPEGDDGDPGSLEELEGEADASGGYLLDAMEPAIQEFNAAAIMAAVEKGSAQ